tara:strand:+ start:137 stop:541 length:405 start_codon:yes stop_codon:yes gene_type:complete
MFDYRQFFDLGLNKTVLVRNNSGFSHRGPWAQVSTGNNFDKWFVGEISAAEYTISIDYNTQNKEILKCLVAATVDKAEVTVYARSSVGRELVDIEAHVNKSFVDIFILPKVPQVQSAKFIFTVNYFENQNPLGL